MKRSLVALLALACASARPVETAPAPASESAPTAGLPRHYTARPTTPAITAADLMSRLYPFADDSMMGREAGTIYNDKGTAYIEREVRRLGLQPGGEDGTFFQHPLVSRTLDPASVVEVAGRRLAPWTEFAPRDQGNAARAFDGATAVYGGSLGEASHLLANDAGAGKLVVLTLGADPAGAPLWNVNRRQIVNRFSSAAAIAVVQLDAAPPAYVDQVYRAPQIGVAGSTESQPSPSYFYVNRAAATVLLGTDPAGLQPGAKGRVVNGRIAFADSRAPGRNVIAILPGSDPALRGEYVAIGAHNDHIGTSSRVVDHDSIRAFNQIMRPQGADSPSDRVPTADELQHVRQLTDSLRQAHGGARPDSIYNGADDDGSGSMGLLEIAEAFATAKERPKRSMLFVWHVAEELGLYGSEYFTDHPTVPRDSIVAQLNIDMIGRGAATDVTGDSKDGAALHGGPGYVQLIGSRRLSTELGDLAEAVNTDRQLGLRFDYALDANGHPQNIYCRSDHYMYARYGIPIVFFTTGGHADYHQVTDEPQYIDYDRLERVATLVHDLGWRVANLDHRPVVDQPKPDPHGRCRQ